MAGDDRWVPDATALRDFRENPEKFRLRHRLGLVRGGWDDALDGGRCTHKAIDRWFASEVSDVEAAVEALHAAWDGPPALFDASDRGIGVLERAMRGYATRWPREQDGFAVLASERYVEARIERAGVVFDWCGIVDRRIRFADGADAVCDLKTTGGWFHTPKTAGWFTRHELGEQMLGYLALEQALGRDTRVYYIDAIHLGPEALKPERDFARWRCPGLVEDWRLDRWARDVAWTLDEIKRLEDARGLDNEWPVYTNWSFNKPDEYTGALLTAPELRFAEFAGFERRPWRPKEVAGG